MMKKGNDLILIGLTVIIGMLFISGCSLPFTTAADATVAPAAVEPIFVTPTSPITGPTVIVITTVPEESATRTEMPTAMSEVFTATPDMTATPSATKNPYLGMHTVLSGETLYAIGRAYVVDPKAIAIENGIPHPYTIYRGQELKIPPVKWEGVPSGTTAVQQFTPDWDSVDVYTIPTVIVAPYYPSSH